MTRQHRHEAAYPALWRAVAGAIRDAQAAHPQIEIPDRWRASIVKRVVGAVLAQARAGQPAEMVARVMLGPDDIGAQCAGVAGVVSCDATPKRLTAGVAL